MGERSDFDEILITLLWAAETLLCPSMSHLLESLEGWEYRHGLKGRVDRTEQRALIARQTRAAASVVRLTATGRQRAQGGVAVTARWSRAWDGLWRQVLFDLPARKTELRQELWRWLRRNRFGYLQKSVWVTPVPLTELTPALAGFTADVESLLVMEARGGLGYTDAAVVAGAWDFAEINQRYDGYLQTARLDGREALRLARHPRRVGGWLRAERVAWRHALAADPLLPKRLLPAGYRGVAAWEARRSALKLLARAVFGRH